MNKTSCARMCELLLRIRVGLNCELLVGKLVKKMLNFPRDFTRIAGPKHKISIRQAGMRLELGLNRSTTKKVFCVRRSTKAQVLAMEALAAS